ncbi:MarC family protein [Methanomethylovorans sp.]|uniref:MarC family protein n=1 Tax=Methanomethylovorans sp. TaxID=2758717 RepID=UPI00351C2A21
MDDLAFLTYTFISIFVIVNPISGVVTFISLTSRLTFEEKNILAKRAVFLACIIALFFAITGKMMLDLFGITVDSLRIAGGILLFHVALDMMFAKVSRESITENEISESQDRSDIWIFPIALPLLTGPGAITTVIVLVGSTDLMVQKFLVILSILLTFLVCLVVFLFSRRIYKYIGYTGMLVFTRIMGLFLAALAADFVTTGIWNVYTTLSSVT